MKDIHYSLVSGNYFRVLGLVPVLDRFLEDADLVDRGSLVISYGLWERGFGRDPAALGKTLRIGDRLYTVVGVAPREFFGVAVGQPMDAWLPITKIDPGTLRNRGAFVLRVMARLKPGITDQQAGANLDPLSRQLKNEWKL